MFTSATWSEVGVLKLYNPISLLYEICISMHYYKFTLARLLGRSQYQLYTDSREQYWPRNVVWLNAGLLHNDDNHLVPNSPATAPARPPSLGQTSKSEWRSLWVETIWTLLIWDKEGNFIFIPVRRKFAIYPSNILFCWKNFSACTIAS